jgi:F-type H+-transporting ATPase subunit a
MTKKERSKAIILFAVIAAVFLVAGFLTGGSGEEESIQEMMRDSVVHEINKVSLFGMEVNPALLSAVIVSGIMIIFALICRIFFIPKFKIIPESKIQIILETLVGLFNNMAKNSSEINRFLGAYLFAAGSYIFTGTMFELFGVQAITTHGLSISLPAPLADINGAIMMGCLTYLVIMSGGVAGNGISGIGKTLKDFSLPLSLSFRLFGALLSGALVTELVYHYTALSIVLPVIVGVLFTVLHALIQAYVLTMLASIFYGEVSEHTPKKKKKKKEKPAGEAQATAA